MLIVLSWAAWQRKQSRARAREARKSVGEKGGSNADSEGNSDSEESENGSNGEKRVYVKDICAEEKTLESGRERFVSLLRKRRKKRRGFLGREMELRGVGM